MISQLRLMNFRCFESLSLEMNASGALFVGDNAQGKTSILEAVCMLVRLHSPRAGRNSHMVKFENNELGVAGSCWDSELQIRYSSHAGMKLQVEGEPVDRQAEYLAAGGLIVWMGNEDIELIRGSGSVRRRYLDFIGSQLSLEYRVALVRYQRALKSRNHLLKDQRSSQAELDAYAQILIENGQLISQQRSEMVERLSELAGDVQRSISAGNETLALSYQSGSGDDLAENLQMTAQRERRLGQTVVGPHRDELKLSINGMPAGDFASEGQQRTIALALKLAQGELLQQARGKLPVYLLDDIFGELDTQRRNAVFARLPEQAQKLITTTNLDWLDGTYTEAPRYRVSSGVCELIE